MTTMKIIYSLFLLAVIPCVALWAAGVAIKTAVNEGALLLGDVWT